MRDGSAAPTLHPDTITVGRGYDPRACFGAIKPPVVMTSTFAYPSALAAKEAHAANFDGSAPAGGAEHGYIYARLDHPNLSMVQERLTALDGAEDAAAFASGMAAISATMLASLRPGDTLLHTRPLYGGTHALLHDQLVPFGITPFALADALDPESFERAGDAALIKGPIGVVFLETPANPTAGLADIALAARFADAVRLRQGRRPLVVVDNTFLGPFGQSPLEQGADLSVMSLTKYAGGHSDLLGGVVSGSAERVGAIKRLRTLLGSPLDPQTSWLVLRSLETLHLRTERAGANAATVATVLRGHPKVEGVTYLGFLPPGTPARAVFDRQCAGAGSTFSFRIRGGEREAFAMLDRLRVLRMAVSLGGTETLICHSATTTHYATPRALREEVGVDDSSLRVSIGIEHAGDLIADLSQALDAIP